MNQDRPMTPESCAKEIVSYMWEVDASDNELADIAAIIQRLLSSEVAKVHGEYQKLAEQLKHEAEYGHLNGSQTITRIDCANRIEALAPNKER